MSSAMGTAAVRVGSAAWAAARGAWQSRATAAAKVLIAERASHVTRTKHGLGAGTHAHPQWDEIRNNDAEEAAGVGAHPRPGWPPGAAARPGRAARHVIDGLFTPAECATLAGAAATVGPGSLARYCSPRVGCRSSNQGPNALDEMAGSNGSARPYATGLECLRNPADGEAAVAALGRVGEGVLGEAAFDVMRDMLGRMAAAAGDATGRRGLHPVGGLLTHITPGEEGGEGEDEGRRQRRRGRDDGVDGAGGGASAAAVATTTGGAVATAAAEAATASVDPMTGRAHGYWSAHVDKANVPEYDVSVVLYLSGGAGQGRTSSSSTSSSSSKTSPTATAAAATTSSAAAAATAADEEGQEHGGADFAGGAFTFLDEHGVDRVVTPRAGWGLSLVVRHLIQCHVTQDMRVQTYVG